MTETYRDNRRKPKPRRRQGVRLNVEELEGRCLLSSGFGPLGGITTGPDGDIWFLEKDRLGRIDPHSGLIQEFAQGISPDLTQINPEHAGNSIAEAPDGSIWFLSNNQPTRFTPSTNALDTFNLFPGRQALNSVIIGPDGVVWVLELQSQAFEASVGIARIDPATRNVQDYGMGHIERQSGNIPPWGIGFAPDGEIWIGSWMLSWQEMDPATGVVQNNVAAPYPTGGRPPMPPATPSPQPASPSFPWYDYVPYSKVASDGSYWSFVQGFPRWCAGCYGIDGYYPSTGVQKQFDLPDGAWIQLTPGPDGNIWFTYAGTTVYYVGQLNPTTGAFESFSRATPSQAPTGNPPPATGTTLSATAGFDFVSAVASFTPQAPIATPGQAYQATVDWGDGTTSSIVLTVTASGTYDVVASHVYQTARTYSIKVTMGNYDPANPLGDSPITVFSTATVDPFNMNM
jgi:hypothetical protein